MDQRATVQTSPASLRSPRQRICDGFVSYPTAYMDAYDLPHQRRDTLEDVLVEVRVTRVLTYHAQDCDKPRKDLVEALHEG